MSRFSRAVPRIKTLASSPRTAIAGVVLVGLFAFTGAAAFATRSASDQFATKAFEKLGGNSDEILDRIADKVVEKLTSTGGTLDAAREDLVNELAATAGKKLGKVDPKQLINGIRADVVEAGLSKFDGISVDGVVAQVTSALIADARTLLDDIDVAALAQAAIGNVIKNLDLKALVKEKVDSIDVNALISKQLSDLFGGTSSSASANSTSKLFSLLSLLGRR